MNRPRILFLHAFPLDCRMWASQREAVERAGYETALPDLPGPEAEPTLAAWAEHVLRLSDDALVPVGSSMGGYVAFEVWRQAPDRVAALVLSDTRAAADSEDARRARDENIRLLDEEGVAALWDRLVGKLFSPRASPDVIGQARELALEQGTTRLAAALAAMRDRPDSTPLLGEINVPVLVVTGAEDTLIPPTEADALAHALPDARLVRVPGGHLPPLEQPDAFNRVLLDFLAEAAP